MNLGAYLQRTSGTARMDEQAVPSGKTLRVSFVCSGAEKEQPATYFFRQLTATL